MKIGTRGRINEARGKTKTKEVKRMTDEDNELSNAAKRELHSKWILGVEREDYRDKD